VYLSPKLSLHIVVYRIRLELGKPRPAPGRLTIGVPLLEDGPLRRWPSVNNRLERLQAGGTNVSTSFTVPCAGPPNPTPYTSTRLHTCGGLFVCRVSGAIEIWGVVVPLIYVTMCLEHNEFVENLQHHPRAHEPRRRRALAAVLHAVQRLEPLLQRRRRTRTSAQPTK
jgi:hypothetical protein